MLSRHISYLKDFFRSYKDFTTAQLDTIELMLQKLYRRFDMDDYTDFSQVAPDKFPTMSDFYDLLEEEYDLYDAKKKNLFSEEIIQEVCLGLHSMCKGAESKYFNGHTNIKDDKFLVFGVKGIMELNRSLRDALLFSILSYMTNALLGAGNYVGALDELYLFLTNLTAIEYIRNLMKRDRKKDSLLVLASQNIEDFLQPGVRELTKPCSPSLPTNSCSTPASWSRKPFATPSSWNQRNLSSSATRNGALVCIAVAMSGICCKFTSQSLKRPCSERRVDGNDV